MPPARCARARHSQNGRALPTTFTLVALVALAASAHANTVSIPCQRHNTLYQESGDLSDGVGPTIIAGREDFDYTFSLRRGLVRFAVDIYIPAGSTITNVQLVLNCARSESNAATSLLRVTQGWGAASSDAGYPGDAGALARPGDATWVYRSWPGSPWTTAGGDFSAVVASIPTTPLGTVTIGSTSSTVNEVQSWLNTPASNFGWLLVGNESTSNAATANVFFAGPTLTVSYLPPVVPAKAPTWGRVKALYR